MLLILNQQNHPQMFKILKIKLKTLLSQKSFAKVMQFQSMDNVLPLNLVLMEKPLKLLRLSTLMLLTLQLKKLLKKNPQQKHQFVKMVMNYQVIHVSQLKLTNQLMKLKSSMFKNHQLLIPQLKKQYMKNNNLKKFSKKLFVVITLSQLMDLVLPQKLPMIVLSKLLKLLILK